MKLHANATLTVAQRKKVKSLFENGSPVSELTARFNVHETTIRRWIKRDSPFDKPAFERSKRVVTTEYEQAIIKYRKQHPNHGPIRIALGLQEKLPFAHRGTIALILKQAGLTKETLPRVRTNWKIPVGRHRLQCDVQELPAIKGKSGFEYKISFIHLRTRWKYSEIHPDQQTETIAGVYQRALDNLPPFS